MSEQARDRSEFLEDLEERAIKGLVEGLDKDPEQAREVLDALMERCDGEAELVDTLFCYAKAIPSLPSTAPIRDIAELVTREHVLDDPVWLRELSEALTTRIKILMNVMDETDCDSAIRCHHLLCLVNGVETILFGSKGAGGENVVDCGGALNALANLADDIKENENDLLAELRRGDSDEEEE